MDNFNATQSIDVRVSQVMKRVYFKMFLAMLVSAFSALAVPHIEPLAELVYTRGGMLAMTIIEVGLVLWISAGISRMKTSTANLLFFLYSIVNGAVLSLIFVIYDPAAIVKTFFITAATFGAMTIYGYFTNRSLQRVGTFLVFALIGLFIAIIVNVFMHSREMDYIISIVGVLIFIGLTAWDTQKIKQWAVEFPDESMHKVVVMGALTLYLDFINMFLFLLRIFGGRR